MGILADLKDPRVEGVTVTYVEVTPDMRNAKVHVSIMGDETAQRLCLQGLQSSAGFLQQKISRRIDTRYTPRIRFVIDMGVKNSIAIARMLNEVITDDVVADDVTDNVTNDGQPADEKPNSNNLDSTENQPSESE